MYVCVMSECNYVDTYVPRTYIDAIEFFVLWMNKNLNQFLNDTIFTMLTLNVLCELKKTFLVTK